MNRFVDTPTELTVFNESIRIFRTEQFTLAGCGNKEFKLKKNLLAIKRRGCSSVLSFGGAWSNHLHAFSYACEGLGLTAMAAVRGEEQVSNELLQDAVKHGLKVHYLSRTDYRLRDEGTFVERLCASLGCDTWLPEGGSNEMAVEGCKSIAVQLNNIAATRPTHIVVAVGTGATLAGIICGAEEPQQVIGVPVVRDDRLEQQVAEWVGSSAGCAGWTMLKTALPQKYGKVDKSLLDFVLQMHDQHGIIMDPVYNGKAFLALLDSKLDQNPDNKIVFVHTGGIVGCLGFKEMLAELCDTGMANRYLADARSMVNISETG